MAASPVKPRETVAFEPLHLIAAFDDQYDSSDVTSPNPTASQSPRRLSQSRLQKQLSRDLTGPPTDVSLRASARVYIDTMNGSDNGQGTRQAPYQSMEGALRATNMAQADYYLKKRFVRSGEQFDPVKIPPNAIPIRIEPYLTEYWYPLQVDPALRAQIESEKQARYGPPSYDDATGEKKRFTSRMKKAFQ